MNPLSPELRHDTARRAVEAVKNVPAFRRARRKLVRSIRANKRARRMAHQVFALPPSARGRRGAGTPPVDLTAGSLLGGVGTESLRVVLIVLAGRSAEEVGCLVEEVAELQVLDASFRPVFVLDGPAFAPIRRFGYPAELLIAEDAWDDPDVAWETYLRLRLGSIVRFYRCSATVRPTSGRLHPVDRALLASGS